MQHIKRVVITGIGVINALGSNVDTFDKNLFNGVSGAAPITLFDVSKFKTKFACEIKGFDPTLYIEKKEARKMDRFSQIAMAATKEAFESSQLKNFILYNPDRVGVVLGSGIGGLISMQENLFEFAKGDGTPRFNPYFIPKMILDIAAGHISMQYNMRGPNFSVVSACASSTHAIMDAYHLIQLGKVDIIITGGSEAVICEAGVGGFNALKALSERNDSPTTASRPYDKNRDGFVMGEGAGILVLEEYEHAIKRNVKIYGEILAANATADAYHLTAPHPEGLGARNLMMQCLKDANLHPIDIDYINTHGTSTPLGDIAELKAIKEVFGQHIYNINLSSTKSMTGHCLGAAGAIEAIACILAIKNQQIPPTINHFTDDEAIDSQINFTFNKAQKRKVNITISNTFGFGGHNACVIIKKYG